MELVLTLLYILSLHFIADFILQSDRIAQNKGKDSNVLCEHVFIYFCVLLVGCSFLAGWKAALLYASVNALLHFATDFVTSRIAASYYKANDRHNFFVTIGADQLIHAWCLGLTLLLLT
jgi:hypothetical protein